MLSLIINILTGFFVVLAIIIIFLCCFVPTPRRPTDHAQLTIDVFEVLMDNDNNAHFEIVDNKGVDVHDHMVQESLTTSFNALKQWYQGKDGKEEGFKSLKSVIFSLDTVDTIEKAYSTLRSIEKHNCKISSIDTDELTVLNMVWARINAPVNASVKKELIDSLICQLADASIDLDLSRCASGRVTRIIQSLEAIDAEHIINLTSTEAVKRELADKVPLLISQFLKDDIKDDIKDKIDKELRKDYVDTKLLTEQVYSKIVKEYLDAASDYLDDHSLTV